MLEEVPTVQNDFQSASVDTQYQVLWSSIMGEGTHQDSNRYSKVSVLLIYHASNSENSTTMEEIIDLRTTFNERFKFHTVIEHLDNVEKNLLQLQLNAKIASFLRKEDDPDTLYLAERWSIFTTSHRGCAEDCSKFTARVQEACMRIRPGIRRRVKRDSNIDR